MQRVRMVLPFLKENAWDAEVLAVLPGQVASPRDEWLVEGLPPNVPVHRVRALGLGWTRIPGLGTLGWRALPALSQTGRRLLSTRKFDLVYFSTTALEAHLLGPVWKKRYGVPFVVDYQDPWVNDYYHQHPNVLPPGGRFKYGVVRAIHRLMEPRILGQCSGLTAVSAAYVSQIEQRYSRSRVPRNIVLTFPGAQRDFDRIESHPVANRFFDPNDGHVHWVYTGVVIEGMMPALRAIFAAISRSLPEQVLDKLRIHFIGTSYAPPGKGVGKILPLAAEFGLARQVREECDRIPYAEALRCLQEAHALLAIGSDDPGYTASKIYPFLLARKPLLAIYHERSSIVPMLRRIGGAVCVAFGTPVSQVKLTAQVVDSWIANDAYRKLAPIDAGAFEPYTDRGNARALCRFFEACLDPLQVKRQSELS